MKSLGSGAIIALDKSKETITPLQGTSSLRLEHCRLLATSKRRSSTVLQARYVVPDLSTLPTISSSIRLCRLYISGVLKRFLYASLVAYWSRSKFCSLSFSRFLFRLDSSDLCSHSLKCGSDSLFTTFLYDAFALFQACVDWHCLEKIQNDSVQAGRQQCAKFESYSYLKNTELIPSSIYDQTVLKIWMEQHRKAKEQGPRITEAKFRRRRQNNIVNF